MPQVLTAVLTSRHLPQPDNCSDDIFDLMTSCWCKDPDLRPSFAEIAETFKGRRVQAALRDENIEFDSFYTSPRMKTTTISVASSSSASSSRQTLGEATQMSLFLPRTAQLSQPESSEIMEPIGPSSISWNRTPNLHGCKN